jgi:hypothetical protein
MEQKRQQAIESLEYDDQNGSVICQMCGKAVPIPVLQNNTKSSQSVKSKRMTSLRYRIKWIEQHYNNREYAAENIQPLQKELAILQDADAKADKIRSLPLYSCAATQWLFCCSACFDKACNHKRKS